MLLNPKAENKHVILKTSSTLVSGSRYLLGKACGIGDFLTDLQETDLWISELKFFRSKGIPASKPLQFQLNFVCSMDILVSILRLV